MPRVGASKKSTPPGVLLILQDVDYKGHTHHASQDEPQYEIKSDKSDHIAMHKGSALEKLTK